MPRGLVGPGLVAWVAEILQEDLAETEVAWGHARPPCPYHPHPARSVVRDGKAWWICERQNEPLYCIAQGDGAHTPATSTELGCEEPPGSHTYAVTQA